MSLDGKGFQLVRINYLNVSNQTFNLFKFYSIKKINENSFPHERHRTEKKLRYLL